MSNKPTPNYAQLVGAAAHLCEAEFATYAAFLNKAESNLHTCLQDILIASGIELQRNKKDIDQLDDLNKNGINDNLLYEKLCNSIERYLPFLPAYVNRPKAEESKTNESKTNEQKQPTDKLTNYIEILQYLNFALNNCRNGYTHHLHERETLLINENKKYQLPSILDTLFDESVREVKKRFAYDDTLQLLRRQGSDKKPNRHFAYRLFADPQVPTFSRSGLMFFTCLFLTRGEAHSLLSQISGFKRQGDRSAQATRNVFTLFAARPARKRIDSTLTEDRLSLDVLGELMRCPIELYRLMSPEAQQNYHTQADNNESQNDKGENQNENININDDENDGAGIALLRHGDRFAQLAMQYIDIKGLLKSWRFQVDLGSYRYKFYDKDCIDSRQRLRILQKPLRGFGHIQDMERLRKEKYTFHPLLGDNNLPDECPLPPDTKETAPYVSYRYADYHIADNRIGLYNLDTKDESCWFEKDATNPKSGYRNRAPHLWLSLYDLPALVLCLLLEQQKKKADEEKKKTDKKGKKADNEETTNEEETAETLLKKYNDTYRRLFHKLQNGDGLLPGENIEQFLERIGCSLLRPQNLPDRLRAKLNGTSRSLAHYACAKTRELLAETEQRLAVVDRPEEEVDNNEKPRRNSGKPARQQPVREIPAGKAADFLAHDLLYLQPADEAQPKITALDFAALQASLARLCPRLYGSLRRTLIEAKLLPKQGNRYAHPFLEELLNDRYKISTPNLYRNYLIRRKAYLSQCLETAKRAAEGDLVAAGELRNYTFLRADRKRVAGSQTVAELAKAYCSDNDDPEQTNTIALPRGFLQQHLTSLLKAVATKQNANALLEELNKDGRKNTVYLIRLYRELLADDQTPAYYNEERHYRLFDWMDAGNTYPPKDAAPSFADAEKRADYHRQFSNSAKENSYKSKATDKANAPAANGDENKANPTDDVKHLLGLWKAFDDREKQLRLRQAQDELLLMMLRDLLPTNDSKDAKLQPDDMRSGGLHLPTPAAVDIPGTNFRLSVSEISLNDLGKLYTLLRDRRMQGLCTLIKENSMPNDAKKTEKEEKTETDKIVIERQTVKEEFEKYDRLRIAAHSRLLKFEKKAIEAYSLKPLKFDVDKKGKKRVRVFPYLKFYEIFDEIKNLRVWKQEPTNVIDELKEIRNRYCHGGYYPKIKLLPEDRADNKGFGFAEKMYRMLDADCNVIEQYIDENPKP